MNELKIVDTVTILEFDVPADQRHNLWDNWYKLDKNLNVVRCQNMEDIREWSRNRRMKFTSLSAGVEVSTVFLGLDHNFGGGGPPVVFETMVFGGAYDQKCARYCTWDECLAGHDAFVNILIKRDGHDLLQDHTYQLEDKS